MKFRILFVLMSSMTGFFPAASYAQVAPQKVSEKRIHQSAVAVLGYKGAIKWKKVPIADSVKKKLIPRLKIKSSLPDTLYFGEIQSRKGIRYIIPDIAPSKSRSFSYVLYADTKKRIVDVDVLEYRENYGYQIDYPFFRKQFRGKSRPTEVLFRRSIQNISGATISARSLTYSVHDMLALIQQIKLKK